MPIIARKNETQYRPAPEGLYQAVCCDVWEPYESEDHFNPGQVVTQTRIVWQLDEVNPDTDRRFEVSQIYRLSLHEKSKLCQHLEAWRGRKFTSEEKRGFDLEKLIGVNCQLQIVHNVKDGGDTYANVQAIVPVGKGMTQLRVSDGYTRKKDRDASGNATTSAPAESAEGVPF